MVNGDMKTAIESAMDLKIRHRDLLKALDDIANGMIPKVPSADDIPKFRGAMWKWSQKRARDAIEADKVP